MNSAALHIGIYLGLLTTAQGMLPAFYEKALQDLSPPHSDRTPLVPVPLAPVVVSGTSAAERQPSQGIGPSREQWRGERNYPSQPTRGIYYL